MPNDSLNKSINDIKIDQGFKVQAEKMGINTLKDIFEMGMQKLKSHPNFTYTWYTDMLQILKEEKLLDSFQDSLYKF